MGELVDQIQKMLRDQEQRRRQRELEDRLYFERVAAERQELARQVATARAQHDAERAQRKAQKQARLETARAHVTAQAQQVPPPAPSWAQPPAPSWPSSRQQAVVPSRPAQFPPPQAPFALPYQGPAPSWMPQLPGGQPVHSHRIPDHSQAPANPGDLPPELIASIFEQRIKPARLQAPGHDHPVALIMVGQCGAGKSTAERTVLKQLRVQDAVSLDGDDLYAYHPAYRDLALRDDSKALEQCGKAVDVWGDMAEEYVTGKRSNIVRPMFPHETNSRELAKFHELGYHVVVAFVAVDDIRSSQGVASRYLNSRRTAGYGRWADTSNELYQGVLKVADLVDQGYADMVCVVGRGGELLYSRQGPDASLSTRRVIEKERNRPWSDSEKRAFAQAQQDTEQLAAGYNGNIKKLREYVHYIGARARDEKGVGSPSAWGHHNMAAAALYPSARNPYAPSLQPRSVNAPVGVHYRQVMPQSGQCARR